MKFIESIGLSEFIAIDLESFTREYLSQGNTKTVDTPGRGTWAQRHSVSGDYIKKLSK